MQPTNHRIRIGLALVSALLLVLLVLPNASGQGVPVFRIGVIDSTTGDLLRGAQLAVQTINNEGGVRGADGTIFRLELVAQPDSNISLAISNLRQASVIAVLGPTESAQVAGNLSALQGLNVPILTPATDDTLLANDTSDRLVRIRAQEVVQGRALANYVVNTLSASNIVTIQLDVESTASVIGFQTALSALGRSVNRSFLLNNNTSLTALIQNAAATNANFIAIYGPPTRAATTYIGLRAEGYTGPIYYRDAGTTAFRQEVPSEVLSGVVGSTTWSYASTDGNSQAFLQAYVRAFGEVPGALAAAGFDAINLLANAIEQPGDLLTNVLRTRNLAGVQGFLNPAGLSTGETTNYVAITQLGTFGAPQPIARYAGTTRLSDDDLLQPIVSPGVARPTQAPPATATPQGVVLTVTRSIQNVRTGPGLVYDVIGQLREGDQVRVVGANADFTWYAIEFRGRTAWLSPGREEIFGDRGSIPLLAPPPTPTPPPATATPTPEPFPDIIITSASPQRITIGQPFNVSVGVRNQGGANAGLFSIAGNFTPGFSFASFTFSNGLAAGQNATVTLNGTLNGATGPQNVVIVADLNRQVNEGPQGEANTESFVFSYVADRAIQTPGGQASLIITPGSGVTLDGGAADFNWTGQELIAQNGARINIINITDLNQVHYDLIDANLNASPIPIGLLAPGRLIGFVTDQGLRGVLRIDSVVTGGNLNISYRVYAP